MTFIFATLVMALAWVVFSRQFTLGGFAVGVFLGAASLWLIRLNTGKNTTDHARVRLNTLPMQLLSLIAYIAKLAVAIVISGFQVAVQALTNPKATNARQFLISTQDPNNNTLISALSAHAITITPGSLVIDFERVGKQEYMRVHVLDEQTTPETQLIADQTKRATTLKRIFGL